MQGDRESAFPPLTPSSLKGRGYGQLAPVYFAAVRNSRHQNKSVLIIDRIDNAIVSDSNSKVMVTGQLRDSERSRLFAQGIYRRRDPLTSRSVEPAVCTHRLRMKPDFVGPSSWRQLLRTSLQGTLFSTSSRDCSADRLSSRNSSRSRISAYRSTSIRTPANLPRFDT